MTARSDETIAVVGGTGELGGALARRLVRAGRNVIIGSRTAERAVAAARAMSGELGNEVKGDSNSGAARDAGIVLVAVPYAAQAGTLQRFTRPSPQTSRRYPFCVSDRPYRGIPATA